MFITKAASSRALSRASHQLRRPTARRQYATEYEQRTKETLKTSSRLTWLTTTAALGATGLYYYTSGASSPSSTETSSSSTPNNETSPSIEPSSSSPPQSKLGHRHEAAYASDVPKPVEDRHGDTVTKHSIAARKNQDKVRVGKFSGEEFDNHELVHTPGKPGGDFEHKK